MSEDNHISQDLLNDAVREASGKPPPARRAAPSRTAAVPPSADLHSVVNELAGGGGIAASNTVNTAKPADPTDPQALRNTVQDALTSIPPAALVGVSAPASGTGPRRLGLAAAVVVLLLGGAILWWWPKQLSGPAGTLHVLAQAVEQHRSSHNGTLPRELAALAGFPRGAVEWPLRYWKARDATGRTEIIWVPQGSNHYRILLRQGQEVWTVSDREGKPKLVVKGSP